jgi:uncharacterized membrane protein
MLRSAPVFDLAALVWFCTLVCAYWLVTGYEPFANRTIVAAVQRQREEWMRNMARRDNRIVDAQLLGSLSQGNAFFASTSAIAVGGLAAMMGSAEKIQVMLERLPFVASPAVLLEIKLLLLITIFIFAFFKFAWAFRLSHYAAIMIGSTPILGEGSPDECERHALSTARLIGIAAEHTNAGLRSFYYSIAAMAWFFHPLAFTVVATWVLLILVRRDFFSRSRRLLAAAGF